ncbi:MAG: YdcF family protein [Synechococcales bacterium]|nr:YdcF family protein [Synechococcales bacterium]
MIKWSMFGQSFWPTRIWTRLNWSIVEGLATPRIVIVVLLLVILVPWLVRSPVLKQWLSKPALVLLIFYLVTTSPFVASLAVDNLMRFVPRDSGQPADAIVVLSRRPDDVRYQEAAYLWLQERAPKLLVIGHNATVQTRRLIEDLAAPSSPSVLDQIDQSVQEVSCAMTTYEEALFTSLLLQSLEAKRIVLVTDAPHMLRATLTFQSFGLDVIPHPVPLPRRLPSARVAFLSLREYLGLVSYAALGRFEPKSMAMLDALSQKAYQEISARKCRQGV